MSLPLEPPPLPLLLLYIPLFGGIAYALTKILTSFLTAARKAGRSEILTEIIRFSPSRLTRLCREAGVTFPTSSNSLPEVEDENQNVSQEAERLVEETLVQEMRVCLKAELRHVLRPEIEASLRHTLREEIRSDVVLMNRLREEARIELVGEFKFDAGLRDDVKLEVRRDLLCGPEMEALRAEVRREIKSEEKGPENAVGTGSGCGVNVVSAVRAGTRRR
jgi:hypothetical protein